MKPKVKEIIIHGKITTKCLQTYSSLGLDAQRGHRCLRIRSTKDAEIRQVGRAIEVDLLTPTAIGSAVAMGCSFAGPHSHHEISDPLGHRILLNPSFRARHSIAVLTSGGDSPGMNSAIRAIVRSALKWGAAVYGVYAGYEGLIRDSIVRLGWADVEDFAACGGTQLLSARSSGFVTPEGRRQAVRNLARRGITSLIVLGGDGSMRGALVLGREFRQHLHEIQKEDLHKSEETQHKSDKQHKSCPAHIYALKIICIPASIDNDIAYADTVLGADTALHRVSESIASLKTTMDSHRRAVVVEVMGRSCGYIALMAGIITEAQFVLLPEQPQECWQVRLIEAIRRARELGRRGIVVIVAEGATDMQGKPISPQEVCRLIVEETQVETRVLTLGHIQRGGEPSAHDRILGTISGYKAVEAICCNLRGSKIDSSGGTFKNDINDKDSVSNDNNKNINDNVGTNDNNNDINDKDSVSNDNNKNINDNVGTNDNNNDINDKDSVSKVNNNVDNDSNEDEEPLMLCVSNGEYKLLYLQDVINKNEEIAQFANQKNFKKVLESRGEFFRLCLNLSCFKRPPPLAVTNANGTMISLGATINDSLNKTDDKIVGDNKILTEANTIKNTINDNIKNTINNNDKNKNSNNNKDNTNNNNSNTNIKNNKKNKNNKNNKNNMGMNKRLAILHQGKLACGIDVALESFVQYGLRAGVEILIVTGGFQGLIKRSVLRRDFYEYRPQNLQAEESPGGPINPREAAKAIQALGITGLIVLGDESALQPVYRLSKVTPIGILLIPTAVANNLPGTDVSVGSDTALNVVTRSCDLLRSSSSASQRSAFVVEVQGGCGYLALMAGIASAAFESFIPERKYMLTDLSERLMSRFRKSCDYYKDTYGSNDSLDSLDSLDSCSNGNGINDNNSDDSDTNDSDTNDSDTSSTLTSSNDRSNTSSNTSNDDSSDDSCISSIINNIDRNIDRNSNTCKSDRRGTLLIRNELTFEGINAESFAKLLKTDSQGLFEVRYSVLGELQRGDVATPIDCINATILTARAIELLMEGRVVGVIGVRRQVIVVTPLKAIFKSFDFRLGREKEPWWLEYWGVCRALE